MTDQDLDALATVVLAHDFDPVPWADAPEWRRSVSRAVARAAVSCSGLSCAEHARSAWTHEMTVLGWGWGPALDARLKSHPGIVFGELTRGGVRHWNAVVDATRVEARKRGLRITGE